MRALRGFVLVGVGGLLLARAVDGASPIGTEFQINTYTLGAQRLPAVAIDGDGAFVVVWHSLGQDGDDSGIFAQRFDSSGAPQGGEFQVNTHTLAYQANPSIAMATAGGFIVVWESSGQDGSRMGVFGARFDSSGSALDAEFQVSSYTEGYQRRPQVAAQANGSFVVAWQSDNQDGMGPGVFAARFDAGGTRVGDEFQVNNYTIGFQQQSRVASHADGDFVITWMSFDEGGNGIFARRFDGDGTAHGPEFQVNAHTISSQAGGGVGMDAGGGFTVAWNDFGRDGDSSGVFARRFDSTGAAETADFQVNTYTTSDQTNVALAMKGGGDFLVVWQSLSQDGDSDAIFAQLYRRFSGYDVDGNGEVDPLTDGLLLLRYDGCTRCDAPSIEAFIAGHL